MEPHGSCWLTLLRPYAGRQAGECVKAASLDEARRLVAEGVGEACEDPETAWVRDAVQKAASATLEAVDRRLDALAKSAGGMPQFAVPRDARREKTNGFAGAGEFWQAVAAAGTPGRPTDARLVSKAPLGVHSNDGGDGGFLVPEAIGDRILEIVYDESNLLARTDTQAISGNSIALKTVDETSRATGSRRGGVRGYWLSEAEQHIASKPKFREMTLKPHKLGVFYYATDEELADAAGVSLENKLAQYAAEEIGWLVSESIVAGDGVGKPLGILHSPCLIVVDEEAGQTADTILFANVVKMYSRMAPRSLPNAVWLVSASCMPQLLQMTFPGPTGSTPAFLAGNAYPSAARAPFGTLLGRPIVVTEHNPALGDLGDILFVDLSMYKTVTRGSLAAAMSIHVRFDYGETAFRFDFRVDGQPWLQAPIQPAKGGATQSPFVALNER